jgi:hypothetical protein
LDVNGDDAVVFKRSIAGIKDCEVFFAWFEDLEAHGTLIEVGIAHALRKRIVVGYADENIWHKLWFAAYCAEESFHGSIDECLKTFGIWLNLKYPVPREQALVRDLSEAANARACVVYGDPIEAFEGGCRSVGEFHNGKRTDILVFGTYVNFHKRDAAALAARQARFEHGQSG